MCALNEVVDRQAPAIAGDAAGPAEGGTLVLGLGNELRGDDGLGPAVVRALTAHRALPAT
jgi:hypothetical protein